MNGRDEDLIFLLGAGCSVDAGIPASQHMLQNFEAHLKKKSELWKLFNYIKSTYEYRSSLLECPLEFNIEQMLLILEELKAGNRHSLFFFTKGWSDFLVELSGDNFTNVNKLIDEVRLSLPQWISLRSYDRSTYYQEFFRFQKEWNFPLRIFSLNYDLCLEMNREDSYIEQGFGYLDYSAWNCDHFYLDIIGANVYLYKIHGSIAWYIDQNEKTLRRSASPGVGTHELIFGVANKFASDDPYLFYLSELRRYSLETKVIVTIGYSYNDEHINKLLSQALHASKNKVLICVDAGNPEEIKRRVLTRLNLSTNARIYVHNEGARHFLMKDLNRDYILGHIASVSEKGPF